MPPSGPETPKSPDTLSPAGGSSALEFHPMADIFPLPEEQYFQALAKDITARGLLEDIVLCGGKILDGRCRYRACERTGVAPKFKEYLGDDPLGFVIIRNVHRRHLTRHQRLFAAARAAALPIGSNQNTPGLPIGRAAQVFEVSERSVARAKVVLRHGTVELIQAAESGKVAVSRAVELCGLPPEAQLGAVLELADRKRHPRQKKKPTAVAKENASTVQVADGAPPESSPGGGGCDRRNELDTGPGSADLATEDELAFAWLMTGWDHARNPARIKFIGELIKHWSEWGIDQ